MDLLSRSSTSESSTVGHTARCTDDGAPGLNYLCSGLYAFYDHIGPDVVAILQRMGRLPTPV